MKIGIMGAGQLGRMTALAGYPLGMQFRFYDSVADAPAFQLAEEVIAPFEDRTALEKFAGGLDLVTYEFENVPAASAKIVASRVPFFPPPEALDIAQDRFTQKSWFKDLGVATAPFARVDSREELETAAEHVGLPAVLKTRRRGYD